MKASEALIAWTPAFSDGPMAGKVAVGPLLREHAADWTHPYQCTGGAAYTARRKMAGWKIIAFVFIDFHTLVVANGLDPNVVHEAFLGIDEYRQRMSPDISGAEEIPEDEEYPS